MITVTIKNPNHLKNILGNEKQHGIDAGRSAIRQESYRLHKLLQKEIKAGHPGGQTMAALGAMARETKRGASDRQPLARMRHMMKYELVQHGSIWYARLGYIPGLKGTKNIFPKGTKISWGRIMELHEAGVSINVTEKMRRKFVSRALGAMGKWKSTGRSGAKVFVKTKAKKGTWTRAGRSGGRVFTQAVKQVSPYFVRKASMLKIPSRPIIYPFWQAHKSEAMSNIKRNFKRIMGSEKRRMLNR